MKSIKEIIALSTDFLEKAGVESARVEAEWLISFALGMKRMDLYLQFDKPLPESNLAEIRPLLSRRAKGEPVQYICGDTEFYGFLIKVGPGVLIPRPETELLVDQSLKLLKEGDNVLDLCTGSGAIAIALSKSKTLNVTATDICPEALKFAKENIKLNEAEVELLSGDLLTPLSGRLFDLICSNPPYVMNKEAESMGPEVLKFEPHKALFAGGDGLDILRRIAGGAGEFLKPGGSIVCEIGSAQGAMCLLLFKDNGWRDVEILQDYTGRDRFVKASL